MELLDTTAQHSSHVYSNNCKICTKKQSTDAGTEKREKTTASAAKMGPSAGSSVSTTSVVKESSTGSSSDGTPSTPVLQPKRVQIVPESTNKFLKEAAKFLSTDKNAQSNSTLISNSDSSNSNDAEIGRAHV